MAGLIVAAFGVCAVALVGLGYAVLSLRAELDSMSRRFDVLSGTARGRTAEPATPIKLEAHEPVGFEPASAVTTAQAAEAAEEPPVLITGMADEGPDPEPTVSRVVSVTLAGPLIKVAAFSHGVHRALREESRMRITYAFRRELKQQRKLRRRQSYRRTASQGWRS